MMSEVIFSNNEVR